MKLDERLINRFDELIKNGHEILNSKGYSESKSTYRRNPVVSTLIAYNDVDLETSHKWGMDCLLLLNTTFGPESDHYKRFSDIFFTSTTEIERGLGIIKSAKDNYEKGFQITAVQNNFKLGNQSPLYLAFWTRI